MAFTVCTENPIENVKSYGLKSYLISLRFCMQKHCSTSSGRESRIEIEFGWEMCSLHGCNKSLYFQLQGRQLLSRRKFNLLFLETVIEI